MGITITTSVIFLGYCRVGRHLYMYIFLLAFEKHKNRSKYPRNREKKSQMSQKFLEWLGPKSRAGIV